MTVEQFKASAGKIPPAQPVLLRGTVTGMMGDDAFFLQDATGGILVYRPSAPNKVQPGAYLEVSGISSPPGAARSISVLWLQVLRESREIAPVDVAGSRPLSSTHSGQLVRFRARVSSSNAAQPASPAVIVNAFGSTASILMAAPKDDGSLWPGLQVHDLVEITGIAHSEFAQSPSAAEQQWSVVVPSRTALRKISSAPWFYRYRWPLGAAGCLLLGALATGLVVVLRRRSAPPRSTVRPPSKIGAISQLDSRCTPLLHSPPTGHEVDKRYQEIFESATDIILTHDLDGLITSFNPAGERILGWKAAEVIGLPIFSILAPAEAEIAGGLVKGGRTEAVGSGSFHLEFSRADGTTVPFEVNSWIEYQDGEPVGVQAICRDISQRLRVEDERIRFERKLQDSQKLESLGILAGGVAHDFNNLLTAILGNASLARLELPAGSPTCKSMEEIEMAAERAADLCSQMLAYSGQGRFVVSRIALGNVVMETLELIQASVSKRVKLDINLAETLPPVHGDGAQLRQVLLNLVTNASEAFGEGHGTIGIRTSMLRAEPKWAADAILVPEAFEGDYVLLEVSDTATGMNPETVSRIFEPFFTTKFTGRGLGLAAVLGIVRSHRGAIKVQTTLGQGTVFQIALPALGVPASPSSVGRGGDGEARPVFQGSVLVVDDEASVRRTLTRVLEMMGCKVLVAEDGTVALDRLRQSGRKFDLIMLDLTMPRMDGVQTLREIRNLRPELPVILMSGFAQAQAMARFNEHRLAGFLQKPFKLEEMTAIVGRVLTRETASVAGAKS